MITSPLRGSLKRYVSLFTMMNSSSVNDGSMLGPSILKLCTLNCTVANTTT